MGRRGDLQSRPAARDGGSATSCECIRRLVAGGRALVVGVVVTRVDWLDGAAPGVGAIAAVGADGSLAVVGADGATRTLSNAGTIAVAFPAWSPDGTRLAASLASAGSGQISVFRLGSAGGSDAAAPPAVVYRSADHPAFYLSWTRDSQNVSFLANDGDLVALGVAADEGGQPVTELGPGSLVRRGAPLYFDWVDRERLLLHVGTGTDAFLGEVGRDGIETGDTIERPGDFRSAEVSVDRRFLAWVRSGPEHGDVIVASRDGASEHALPVFGSTALGFAPDENVVATIGADSPGQADLAFPLGPLRVIDASSGAARTLLDGSVVAFFWAPDGGTIAALRLQPPGGPTAVAPARLFGLTSAAGPVAAGSPSPAPSEPHLLFVDVATGRIRSDRAVQPGGRFVSEYLPYFDQYGLSHRLWAPDGSAFLMPLARPTGATDVEALAPDGGPAAFTLTAEMAFWTP